MVSVTRAVLIYEVTDEAALPAGLRPSISGRNRRLIGFRENGTGRKA